MNASGQIEDILHLDDHSPPSNDADAWMASWNVRGCSEALTMDVATLASRSGIIRELVGARPWALRAAEVILLACQYRRVYCAQWLRMTPDQRLAHLMVAYPSQTGSNKEALRAMAERTAQACAARIPAPTIEVAPKAPPQLSFEQFLREVLIPARGLGINCAEWLYFTREQRLAATRQVLRDRSGGVEPSERDVAMWANAVDQHCVRAETARTTVAQVEIQQPQYTLAPGYEPCGPGEMCVVKPVVSDAYAQPSGQIQSLPFDLPINIPIRRTATAMPVAPPPPSVPMATAFVVLDRVSSPPQNDWTDAMRAAGIGGDPLLNDCDWAMQLGRNAIVERLWLRGYGNAITDRATAFAMADLILSACRFHRISCAHWNSLTEDARLEWLVNAYPSRVASQAWKDGLRRMSAEITNMCRSGGFR